MNYKIDTETAIIEFEKICESWEIDIDENEMDSNEKIDFSGIKKKIVKAIKLGRLVYNGDGTMTYTISGDLSGALIGRELTIKKPMGDSYTGMDDYKEQASMHKTYAVLSSMISFPVASINKLDGTDLKPLLAISTLFLAD